MVVFVGETSNTTVTLMKQTESMQSLSYHTLPLPLYCYYQVFGFDVESDGLIGTLPVTGVIRYSDANNGIDDINETKTIICSSIEERQFPSEQY